MPNGTPMIAAMKMPMIIRRKLANTDIQNLLSWTATKNASSVGPGRNPLNCENSSRVKMKVETIIQTSPKQTRPMISNFHPKSRLPKTAFNPTCFGSRYMNRLIDFNDLFPCIWFFQITLAESVDAAQFIHSL